MSFHKHSIGLSSTTSRLPLTSNPAECRIGTERQIRNANVPAPTSGIRPSPLDGRPTISTGTPTLDGLLAGHAGLPLGSSLLLEEMGTTDFAGTLLRFHAAEGVVQGHQVHVVGVGDQWGRELPGTIGVADGEREKEGKIRAKSERMKIAWRYQRLGEIGVGVAGSRGGVSLILRPPKLYIGCIANHSGHPQDAPSQPVLDDPHMSPASPRNDSTSQGFCHTFDLAKRLTLPSASAINIIPSSSRGSPVSPFHSILQHLTKRLSSSASNSVHRLIIPTLLSPAVYPALSSEPRILLEFLHSLRGLLRRYPMQLTAMITLPLELFPRTTGIIRWAELVCDGVLEVTPFPNPSDVTPSLAASGAAITHEDQPQGMLKVHQLPVFHEKGGGGGNHSHLGDDLAFTVSRRKFTIKPFSLPPVEGNVNAQQGRAEGVEGKPTKIDLEF
ncbi:MAG: hypothetical protein M1827_002371 [Pycnora praestabilis]|nr:MAG: hypothetical protein M1827_002371 [Pycnora praestabilis]